ncbi:ATP-binding cassette domain-containing protein [Idiomarina aminovorans]|uniref:ATP-binding cassette domain-containing protein n=1 Tax=Idiomarina aminovorans TaxID=2914829 RepID=UPI0020049AF7|nr:ATP-binding cassette domain-containing protein [Idiomarina sp. ATCH4]MCK7460364.1 ATP-binding cassette domain-containing protein [Idiomarina sp. ATCH4]
MLDIDVSNLSIGRQQVLSSLNLSVEANQFVAIVGENGAGKSTFLNMLAGELPYLGWVYLNGKELNSWEALKLAPIRAVMEQQLTAPEGLSVQELVAMGRYWSRESDADAEKRANGWLERFDLVSMGRRSIESLSGGEQQRAHLARCLCQLDKDLPGEQLLLLDEPTSALDVYHQHAVLHEIKSFSKKGNLVLSIMHDLNLASLYADKVIVLGNGCIQHIDTPESVFREDVLERTYHTPVYVSSHPSFLKPMIFTEPRR